MSDKSKVKDKVNNKEKNKVKDKKGIRRIFANARLLSQIEIVFFISILLAMYINNYISNKRYTQFIMENTQEACINVGITIENRIELLDNRDWLFNYWRNNYESMEIDYNNPQEINDKIHEFIVENPGVDLYGMSIQEIENLSDNSQRLYAEVEYLELIIFFDGIKSVYKPAFLACIGYENETAFFYISGALADEKRGDEVGDIFQLGVTIPMNLDDYPMLKETVRTGKNVYTKDHKSDGYDENEGRYHVWIPVYGTSGDVLAYIGVSDDVSVDQNLIKEIRLHQNLISLALFLVSGFVLIFIVKTLIFRPLNKLKKVVDDYSENNDSSKLKQNISGIESKNEIGILATSFKQMAISIDEYTDEVCNLATKQERLTAELDIATDIQKHMMPVNFKDFTKIEELDLYASMNPAKEVGGDFYDFFKIDDDHIGLVMADVSGKGIPAALLMMTAKSLIKTGLLSGESPKDVLARVNNQLLDGDDMGYFVTAWIAKLELSTGQLITASAGHEYPFIKGQEGTFDIYKDKHGAALGAFDDTEYFEEVINLKEGNKVFIYTDGVPEANRGDDDLFGMERLNVALNRLKDKDCQEIILGIKKEVDDFVKDLSQFDDITMMCLEYKGIKKGDLMAKKTYEADVSMIGDAVAFMEEELNKINVPETEIMHITLCLEEVFTNIASYAYKDSDSEEKGYIELDIDSKSKKLTITFKDSGIPFNPLEKEDPDIESPLEDRPEGGLGIFLVKKYMDDLYYKFEDGLNIFTMTKNL